MLLSAGAAAATGAPACCVSSAGVLSVLLVPVGMMISKWDES